MRDSYFTDLQAAFNYVREHGVWVVLVTPTSHVSEALDHLVVVAPEDAVLCGRTLLFDGGGRVTVCAAQHHLRGSGFTLVLSGFDYHNLSADDEIALYRWDQEARRVTGVDAKGRTLR